METGFGIVPLEDWGEKARQVFNLLDVNSDTREDYSYRIGLFLEFIQKQGFNYNSFLEFKRYLRDRMGLTVATKNKYLASPRVFLKELARKGMIPVDITLNVKGFKQGKKHKKEGISEEEISRLIEKIRGFNGDPRNLRLKALFSLLALQGLRQIEITRLNIEDLDLVNGIAYIQGKGRDDKEPVYLHPETTRILKVYVEANRIGAGALFRSLGNRKSARLSNRTIQREFSALFRELGINKTTHGFRHYYITHLLKNFDVGTVRKFSRHSSLDMLIVYDDEVNLAKKKDKVFACFEGLNVA
ncbi:Tyrosine recombinase XerC [subsurface metagenome]